MTNDIFYIYCHRRLSDGKCFYIGKGKNYRHKSTSSRNSHWWNIVNKHGFSSEILINHLSESKAFELESYFCKTIGYDNLTNIRTETGWGGHTHSNETKKKMSQSHVGKKKPWVTKTKLGKNESEETRNKKRGPKTEQHKANLSKSLKGKNKGRIITWNVGRKKGQKSDYDYSKRIMDYSNVGSKGKKLYQLDIEGNIIKIWDNKKQAAYILGYNMVSIGYVCLGKQKSYKGFIWRYE